MSKFKYRKRRKGDKPSRRRVSRHEEAVKEVERCFKKDGLCIGVPIPKEVDAETFRLSLYMVLKRRGLKNNAPYRISTEIIGKTVWIHKKEIKSNG